MNDISARISLYQNLYQICLILVLICLLIAVTVFFVLDIKSTIGYLTGRQAKKKIKELEAEAAVSGRLRSEKRKNMQYVVQEMKDDMGVRQKTKMGVRKVSQAVEAGLQELVQNKTSMMSEQIPQETTLLPETDVSVNMKESSSTGILEESNTVMGKFLIVREVVMIHTEEVI